MTHCEPILQAYNRIEFFVLPGTVLLVSPAYFLIRSLSSDPSDSTGSQKLQGGGSGGPRVMASGSSPFWDGKFFATCLVIGLLALVSAYLEYIFYPSIMKGPQFGDTQIVPHLSILTFWFSAYRCVAPSFCSTIQGVPSFDFAQLFIIVLVLVVLQRVLRYRRR